VSAIQKRDTVSGRDTLPDFGGRPLSIKLYNMFWARPILTRLRVYGDWLSFLDGSSTIRKPCHCISVPSRFISKHWERRISVHRAYSETTPHSCVWLDAIERLLRLTKIKNRQQKKGTGDEQ
jgi:hypothetical protein